eukprot:gene7548-9827_t
MTLGDSTKVPNSHDTHGLQRSSSFAKLLRAASTDSVSSWIASWSRMPSLARCSSSFTRQVTPDASAPLTWSENTTNIEISSAEIPLFERNDIMSYLQDLEPPHFPIAHQDLKASNNEEEKYPQQDHIPMHLRIESDTRATCKASSWTYSPSLNQVFTNIDQVFPVTLETTKPVPDNVQLHIQLQFEKDMFKPVPRCPTHSAEDASPHREHILQSSNQKAHYSFDEKMRPYFIVPVEKSKTVEVVIDSRFSWSMLYPSRFNVGCVANLDGYLRHTELLKMKCFSSCSGGINRKSVCITFSLIQGSQRLGFARVTVRVCACPGKIILASVMTETTYKA